MTKTISLSDDAYDKLRRRKQEGESFSDVVDRLAGERPLLDVVGTGREGDGVREAVADVRDDLDRSTNRLAAELAGEDDA